MKYQADHHITKDQHVWAFAADMQPVLRVKPGATIHLETWDCFTGQVQSEADTVEKLDLNRVNSATGPIFVEGAMPGDSLAVTLKTIDPGPQGAGMVIPEWGQLIHKSKSPVTRIFKVSDGIVTMNEKVSFPAVPMLGVIGVAPESGAIATFEQAVTVEIWMITSTAKVQRFTCQFSKKAHFLLLVTCMHRWAMEKSPVPVLKLVEML